jgi:hypothetical protein
MTSDIYGRLLRADKLYPAQHGRGQDLLRNVVESFLLRCNSVFLHVLCIRVEELGARFSSTSLRAK